MSARPIQLQLEDASAAASSGPAIWQIALLAAVFILVLMPTISILHRRTALFTRADGDAAFRILASRMRLGSAQCAVIRTLAQRSATPPTTLLICESAFTRALQSLGKIPNTERARLVEVQRRIFADD